MAQIIYSREPSKKARKLIEREIDSIPGSEFAVYHEKDVGPAVKERIEEMLWAFSPGFLSYSTSIDIEVFKAIAANNRCESNNDAIKAIVKGTVGIDELVSDARKEDGDGHFLSQYDGAEYFVKHGKVTWYIYRTN